MNVDPAQDHCLFFNSQRKRVAVPKRYANAVIGPLPKEYRRQRNKWLRKDKIQTDT
jgi:hypothetical protein